MKLGRFTSISAIVTLGTAFFTLCSLFGCTKTEGAESESGSKEKDGYKTVKITVDRKTVLRNPLNGWVMYGSASYDPSYWDKECYVSELAQNVKVSDYASACYIRTNWRTFNPEDGVYAWRDPSTKLYGMIHGAWDRGLPIAFRIVVDGRDQGANTPQFVYDAGAGYYLENEKYPDRKTPYPQDPVFQQYYEKLIAELAKDFNDPEKTAFIDAYGLGKWGEGHNVVYEPDNAITENTEKLKYEVMDWITDVYSKNFTKVPLLINYHRVIRHPTSDGKANENSEALLNLAVGKGYSLRQDAFGMTDYYRDWERAYASSWMYKRPIIMEGGWIVNQHSYWNDSRGYRKGHPEDVRQGEYDDSRVAKVAMMDFRVGDETESWFKDAFSLVQKFVSEGGYRLYPEQFILPEKAKSGELVTLEHKWRNIGWGYFPNNIPQWNYRYKVAFALLDSQDNVCLEYVDKNCEPSKWVDGNTNSYKSDILVQVPAGSYSWAVAIVNTDDENKPAIKLAAKGAISEDGWLKLMEVTVE